VETHEIMKSVLFILMLANASVFVFGALQHAGVGIGPLHEPVIVGATVVETLCASALIWATAALLKTSPRAWRRALIANGVVIAGVLFGMVALALGAGPRTASNDFYHEIMLALAAASIGILALPSVRKTLTKR
jgi:hypothetical protein